MTNWFRQRNINVRAHNLFWAVENFVQPWVKVSIATLYTLYKAPLPGSSPPVSASPPASSLPLPHVRLVSPPFLTPFRLDFATPSPFLSPSPSLFPPRPLPPLLPPPLASAFQNLNDEDLWAAMQRRLNHAVTRYKGQVQHWDVLNEPLHGNYFADRLGPQARLRHDLNQLAVAGIPIWLTELDFNKVPDDAIRADYFESVMREAFAHPAARLRHDLNQLAVAGIPIWLTELDFNKVPDDAIRADYFESVMREAFAHPAVHGIVNWSAGRASCDKYKDVDPGMCKPCEACFSDFNYVDNELGKRYVRLRKEWSTHLNAKISPGQPLAFKGFHGTYRARFQVNGQTVEKTFHVPNAQGVAQISIQL
ncbi:unnamed protein product [Closterium sp. Naga37s-1]|nr:unnamed protein product [Closterium sp. Naga37s-1]